MKQKSFRNRTLSIFRVILIGIFTSALWELGIKNSIFKISDFFAKSYELFYNDYIDEIYSGISNQGYPLTIVSSTFTLVILLIFPLLVMAWVRSKLILLFENETPDQEYEASTYFLFLQNILRKKRWIVYISIFILYLPTTIKTADLTIYLLYSTSAYNIVSTDIEILRPYISDHKYQVLRSDMLQIKSRKNFTSLIAEINSIAKSNRIVLKNKELIGVGEIRKISN